MPPKKKVIKEKKEKKIKQKQSQSQSQKVIINLNEVKTKPKRTRKKTTNKNIKFNEISAGAMPEGWAKYGAQERETNTLRGNLNEIQNKLLTIKNVENPVNNPVNNDERNERIAKIEEGMKNMFISGNTAFGELYSKIDNIGDFSNKTKFTNPVKQEQKKQSQPIYPIKKKDEEKIFIEDDDDSYNMYIAKAKKKDEPKKFDNIEKSKRIFKSHYAQQNQPDDEKQAPPFIINQSNYSENYKKMSSPQSKVIGRPKKYQTDEELKKKKAEDNKKYRDKKKAEAEKNKVGYQAFINNQDDLNEYKQKNKNQRQEADERYKYMTGYMNEIKENNNDTTFL